MHVRLLVFIFLLGAHLNASGNSGYSFSNNNPDQESRFEQRQLYKQLIYLIKTNQRSKYRAKQSQLIDYPLYPYLEYTEKANRISRQSESAISDFVEQYQDTPLANRLLQRWLSSLARRGEWEKLVANYLQEGATDANNCHYAYALHKNDKRDEAIALARKLWLVKFSQPDACDPIFKVWRDSEGLTNDLVWARFSMALTANNVTLATYLMRFIDKKDKALANSFKLAHTKPRYITQTNRFKRKDDKTQSAILHGLKRLARKDAMKALNTLNIYLDSHEFSQEQLDPVLTYIGVRIARDPDTVDALDQIPFDLSKDQQILEAKLRTSLRQLDWRDVLVYIHLLEDEVQQSDRWQYWKARILSASDDSKDQQIATGIYRSLARQRSFYGFMSADVLKVEYNFQDNPISISEEEILALEETPGIERALELFILNERTNARREWNFTTRDFSSRELQIAARVAKK